MDYYSGYINQLIEQLSHLPGIGVKTAQRLAFHIMNMPADQAKRLADSITEAKSHVQYCKCCQTLTDKELCPICANVKRDHSVIMVVETTQDLAAYEKTGKYDGVYHVLHGAISPMLGIGPDDIRLKSTASSLILTTLFYRKWLLYGSAARCRSELFLLQCFLKVLFHLLLHFLSLLHQIVHVARHSLPGILLLPW